MSGQLPPASPQEEDWLQWVEDAFPDLETTAHFLPPVYINRLPTARHIVAGQDVLVPQASVNQSVNSTMPTLPSPHVSVPQPPRFQASDFRDDAAMQRTLFCLQEFFTQNREVLVGLNQLRFGDYLGKPCYAAAAAQLPRPSTLPTSPQKNGKDGEFDVLLIHRQYGLVVCEVKSVGGNFQDLNKSQQEEEDVIKKKVNEAVVQLEKMESMLQHLVSDVTLTLRVTKTIAVPNLTVHQLQRTISSDSQLTSDLLQCLGTSDPAAITGLCLCSDQLSDPQTPWDVSSHVMRELGNWWQRRVVGAGPDSHMTCNLYKRLVARFCGPATTVTVPCTYPPRTCGKSLPRLCVKTLSQAVSLTGECYTALITLFPEQVHLLNQALPRVLLDGPPGTGKTVVLVLMGIEWLRHGHDVRVMSGWYWSQAASNMLHHLLKTVEITPAATACGQIHLVQYDFRFKKESQKALQELSQAANGGPLYVIADESGSNVPQFTAFCEDLLTEVPSLHLWAANCYSGETPKGWVRESLTRTLRCPPVVSREVEKDWLINDRDVKRYTRRGVPHPTDGPAIQRLWHGGQGHSTKSMEDCFACGQAVASFLHTLRVGDAANVPATSGEPPGLRWKDVLVLYCRFVSNTSGMVNGLRAEGIQVQVMKDEDIRDVATAHSDVVWMVEGHRVQGLERKIIVCLKSDDDYVRLYFMSRCTSQLVLVSRR